MMKTKVVLGYVGRTALVVGALSGFLWLFAGCTASVVQRNYAASTDRVAVVIGPGPSISAACQQITRVPNDGCTIQQPNMVLVMCPWDPWNPQRMVNCFAHEIAHVLGWRH